MNGKQAATHLASQFRQARKRADRAVAVFLSAAGDPHVTPRQLSRVARKAAAALGCLASVGALPVRFR